MLREPAYPFAAPAKTGVTVISLLTVTVVLIGYGVVSAPADRRGVTSAIFFVTAGVLIGVPGWLDVEWGDEAAKPVTELALVLLSHRGERQPAGGGHVDRFRRGGGRPRGPEPDLA